MRANVSTASVGADVASRGVRLSSWAAKTVGSAEIRVHVRQMRQGTTIIHEGGPARGGYVTGSLQQNGAGWMSWKGWFTQAANRLLRYYDIQIVRGSDLWRPTSQLGWQPQPGPVSPTTEAPFLKVFQGRNADLRNGFDFAVVMPTTLRATIHEALISIFRQDFGGRVQVLIGVDVPHGSIAELEQTCRTVPERQCVFCFYPGYSSSRRHGGQHAAWDGGALRTVLSYLANARFVAYLDDDNWWASDHLTWMRQALTGAEWAYAGRWFAHPYSRRPICKDEWEAVGPGYGEFQQLGGWSDPNCVALDKQICEAVLPWWSVPLRNSRMAMDADRNVFGILSNWFKGRATGRHTVFYVLNEMDERHERRMRLIGAERYAAAGHPNCPVPAKPGATHFDHEFGTGVLRRPLSLRPLSERQ